MGFFACFYVKNMLKYIYRIRRGDVMSNSKKSNREFSELEAKKQIRRLTIRNNKLEREVDQLKAELEVLQGKGGKIRGTNKFRSVFKKRANSESMYAKRSYPSYVWSHLTHTSFFNIYKRILNYIRKYTFITTTLKIVSLLFVFVEALLLVLISTSVFIVSMLVTVLASHLLMLLGLFARKRHNESNKARLDGKNIVILFPPKEHAFDEDSYFKYMVSEIAKQDNTTAVVVSPFLFKSRSLFTPKKPYYSAREDGENVLLVRKSYYFALRKKIINEVAVSVTEIY